MSASPLASRSLTILASAFLGFDGAALAGLGWWTGRTALVVMGLVLFLASGLVLASWRRHLRRIAEIAAARRDLREETEAVRKLLNG
ncbi:MAG: hypothetical protein H0T68_08765 [Gemmatimonadales bacterium]|nr:hypothetical protein [Gemmatimonadales bacterium]